MLLSAAAVEHARTGLCYARALATENEHTLDVQSLWIKTTDCATSWANSVEDVSKTWRTNSWRSFAHPTGGKRRLSSTAWRVGPAECCRMPTRVTRSKRLSVLSSRGRNTRHGSSCSWTLHGSARPLSPVLRVQQRPRPRGNCPRCCCMTCATSTGCHQPSQAVSDPRISQRKAEACSIPTHCGAVVGGRERL